jgi:hypothetical protein
MGGLDRGRVRSSTYTHSGRKSETRFSPRGCLTSALAYAAFLLLLWLQPFSQDLKGLFFVLSIFVVFATVVMNALAGAGLSSGGWSSGRSSSGSWGGGWSSGGGGFSRGGFSGGGGSFGGGGASGSW